MCVAAQHRQKIHKTSYFGITEIQRLIGEKLQIFPTLSHLAPLFGVTPFEFMEKLYGS